MTEYIYTFIREDISPEQKIVQIGHACFIAGQKLCKQESNPNLVLLSVKDRKELMEAADRLEWEGIKYCIFFEPDNGMGYSAICTEPIQGDEYRSVFRKWNLYKQTA